MKREAFVLPFFCTKVRLAVFPSMGILGRIVQRLRPFLPTRQTVLRARFFNKAERIAFAVQHRFGSGKEPSGGKIGRAA